MKGMTMTIQQILDRLATIHEFLGDAQATHEGVEYDDEDDEAAMDLAISQAEESVHSLKLDIEIDCRREGVAFV